ncbi:MAG: hypothetical protein AAB368_17340 [bacterium]
MKRFLLGLALAGALAWSGAAGAALVGYTLFTNYVSATYSLPSGVPGGGTQPGFNPINVPNGQTAWVYVTDQPQLCFMIMKTADVANAASGDKVCYTISYSNCGNYTVQSVTLTDVVPCNTIKSTLPALYWGQNSVPSATWATSLAGPWNTSSPNGLSPCAPPTPALYLRWIFSGVTMHKTGYIKYCVTVQ